MHQYRVIDRCTKERLCALHCSMGQYHLARALHVMPPVEVSLSGAEPQLGFGILLCNASGAIFRVIFESINDPHPPAVLDWAAGGDTVSNRPLTGARRVN
jgi:hypothetical protein